MNGELQNSDILQGTIEADATIEGSLVSNQDVLGDVEIAPIVVTRGRYLFEEGDENGTFRVTDNDETYQVSIHGLTDMAFTDPTSDILILDCGTSSTVI